VLDLGVELELIEKRGSFYLYKEERLAQGRENAKQVLRENPALCLEIENAIRRASDLEEIPVPPELVAAAEGETSPEAESE